MPKWLSILLHALIIAGGAAGAVATGTPWPLVLTGSLNALVPSPASAPSPQPPVAQK